MDEAINKYGKYVVQIVIAGGSLMGIYTRFLMMENDVTIIKERLDKKIKKINSLEKRIRIIECR